MSNKTRETELDHLFPQRQGWDQETGNNLSCLNCTVCSRTTNKTIEESTTLPGPPPLNMLTGQIFGNGLGLHWSTPTTTPFPDPHQKKKPQTDSIFTQLCVCVQVSKEYCVYFSLHFTAFLLQGYCGQNTMTPFFFLSFWFLLFSVLIIFLLISACVGFCPHIRWYANLHFNQLHNSGCPISKSLVKYMYIYIMYIYVRSNCQFCRNEDIIEVVLLLKLLYLLCGCRLVLLLRYM